MKITVVGGGSTYTPELADGLGRLAPWVTELVLVDPDQTRLAAVGPVSARIMRAHGHPAAVRWTASLDDGADGAAAVLIQLRVGGQAARNTDETWPLDYGCLGQETTGAGGLAKALRTVPLVLDIAEQARRRALPGAWIVDFTNPVGIVTRALLDAGHRAVGLCNVAIGLQRYFAAALGTDPARVSLDHAGLNHLTWLRGVRVDGKEVLPELLSARGEEIAGLAGVPLSVLHDLGVVPSYYLRYFYFHDEVVGEERGRPSRAAEVAAIERELMELYADPALDRKPELLSRRGGAFYSEAAVALIASLFGDGTGSGVGAEQVVNVRNGGTLPFLADDAVIEVPATIIAAGPVPVPVAPLEPLYRGLVAHVSAYEELALDAALRGGRSRVAAALLAHPLIGQYDLAGRMADRLIAENAQFLPLGLKEAAMMRRTGITLAALIALTALSVPGAAAASSAPASSTLTPSAPAAAAAPEIRVNQVGYQPDAPKAAYVMLPARAASVPFTVTDSRGAVVYRGVSRDDAGPWNSRYKAVYLLSFSGLRRSGTYRVRVGAAASPAFRIASGTTLYWQLVSNAVRYFTSERDGADVEGSVLSREPANLTDTRAYVYAAPRYDSDDNLLGPLKRVGGPVNVSGGWFDAGGGYEKFGYTASYADALMLIAARDNPGVYPTLKPEAEFGLQWISKLWNPNQRVLYMQVGIGNGNASNTIQGDYNFWFLPQREDRMDVAKGGNPGPSAYYVKYRPVFEAAAPGHPVSPDLAGRYAADFALGAQLARGASGLRLLSLARSVYADAKTTDVGPILTAYPDDYYPGTEWKSDMLWGAAEIALADEALGAPRPVLRADLAVAARWAKAYIARGHPAGSDTLNLYDNGAVGEAELLRAMRQSGLPPAISPRLLVNDLGAQLQAGEEWAKGDPFALGTDLGPADAAPHAFGLWVTNELYRQAGGSARYQAFAQQQLNFALGANAWGSSFVVGAGTVYPYCMQSEIANLAGSLTGHGDIQLGAATDGPSSPANFVGLGTVSGMRACSAGSFSADNNAAAAYQDNVLAWPSVEPADDYTAISLFAFALGAASGRG